MPCTRTEARDQINALIKAGADGIDGCPVRLIWQGKPDDRPPKRPEDLGRQRAWARVTIQHLTGGDDAVSSASGRRRYNRQGIVTIQLFTPNAHGRELADELAPPLEQSLQGKSTQGGVWFREVVSSEIGEDGPWMQTNITATFEYDEFI